MNKILQNDLDFIKKNRMTHKFNNCNILITGATGFIGSLLTKTFLYSTNAKVFAQIRDMKKVKQVFNEFFKPFNKSRHS